MVLLPGETETLPPVAVAVARTWIGWLVTFLTTRSVLILPGMTGASIEGMLRWMAVSGLSPRAAKSAADSSNVSGAAAACATSMRPEPKSNGSAGVVRSSLTTSVVAVVIRADLIWPGVHVGWAALRSRPEPATCGDDIEVPAMAWKYWPGGPSVTDS